MQQLPSGLVLVSEAGVGEMQLSTADKTTSACAASNVLAGRVIPWLAWLFELASCLIGPPPLAACPAPQWHRMLTCRLARTAAAPPPHLQGAGALEAAAAAAAAGPAAREQTVGSVVGQCLASRGGFPQAPDWNRPVILCHLSACTAAAANWASALASTVAQPQVRLHVTRRESWSDASKS